MTTLNPADSPRMTDADIAAIKAWLLDAVMEPAVREGFGVLLREVELARREEKSLRKQLDEIDRHTIAWCEEVD